MTDHGQKKSCTKTTIQTQSPTENIVCSRMGEPDLRLIMNYMVLWDLSPRQLSGIINGFNDLKPHEKKALVEYSKAVSKLYEVKSETTKPRTKKSAKVSTRMVCSRM